MKIERPWPAPRHRPKTGTFHRLPAVLVLVACLAASPLLGLSGCSSRPTVRPETGYQAVGLASYYGRSFHGRRTASGERYNKNALTAAHPRLPFGTRLQVKNLKNGKTVRVRINDRGPFVKGRIIDLSYAAAKQLGMLRDGVVKVRVTQAQ